MVSDELPSYFTEHNKFRFKIIDSYRATVSFRFKFYNANELPTRKLNLKCVPRKCNRVYPFFLSKFEKIRCVNENGL